MRLASRFGRTNSIRQERPLTNDELIQVVPSIFSEEKHNSRSERYTYIPTITLLDKLRDEGFQPFFACQSRVRGEDKRGHTKHMVRLRREGGSKGKEVPEIILLNSHDGSSSYQMILGCFFLCVPMVLYAEHPSEKSACLIKVTLSGRLSKVLMRFLVFLIKSRKVLM